MDPTHAPPFSFTMSSRGYGCAAAGRGSSELENGLVPMKKPRNRRNVSGKISSSDGAKETRPWVIIAVLACVALPAVLYSRSLTAPFFFDDLPYIVDNP